MTVLAFVVLGFVKGYIVPGHVHQRALAKQDELSGKNDALQLMITGLLVDKVMPTLTRATDLMARAADRERST